MTAAATCLTIVRIAVRHFLLRGLYWDDAFQIAAWLLLLGQNIAYTYYIPSNYELSAIEAGTLPQPPEPQYLALLSRIYTAELVLPLLFWTCLFCAKFSFLWLYRQILRGSGAGMKKWWTVNIALLGIYGIILVGLFAECGPAQNLTDPGASKALVSTWPRLTAPRSVLLFIFSSIRLQTFTHAGLL